MKTFNRRAMLGATPGIIAMAGIVAGSTVAQANSDSDKSLGINRIPNPSNKVNSIAVRHGNVVYTGGVQATDFAQDFVGQTKQTFARIDSTLASFGSSKENLLSVTIRTKSITHKPAFNKAWLEWLGTAGLPARVYAVVADLDEGSLIEIQVTAVCQTTA